MIYPNNFEEKIGFARIRGLLKEKCLSPIGRERVDEVRFSARFEFVRTLLDQTDEMRHVCLFADQFPVSYYFDLRQALDKARIVGSFLTEEEFFDIRRSLDTLHQIQAFFARPEAELQYPSLRALGAHLEAFPGLVRAIDQVLDKFGRVKDNASPELLTIRRDLASRQSSISRRMHALLAKAQQDGLVDTDVSVTMRDGKMLLPVAASNKRKIPGFVYDESATGKTVFIEPLEIIELNNEVKELEFAERREVVRILQALTDQLRPHTEALVQGYQYLGTIDFIRAKALLAIEFEAAKPRLEAKPHIDWYAAVHPLLQRSLKRENKSVVPLNLRLDTTDRILVISGPNAGGKSVCLKTVGLLQYMLQCGLLAPMLDSSRVGIFQHIFIDIGDEQSIENDLSTYSSHLLNMRHFTRQADAQTLFLIDEFGTGTEPLLGGAIAEAVLQHLNQRQAFGIVTTHYTNLKHLAANTPGIVNGAMQYDVQHLRPLFVLKVGKPGSSFAFEIARNIGLSHEILQTATDIVGKEHIDFDKNLKNLDKERQKLENQQRKLQRKQRELDQLIIQHAAERDEAVREKKRAIKEARTAAEQIAASFNKKIENTIAEIKKANAERDRTQELRAELQQFAQDELQRQTEEQARIERKMEKIRQKADRARQNQGQEPSPQATPTEPEIDNRPLAPGDKVRLDEQQGVCEVIELRGNEAIISLGHLRSTVALSRLRRLTRSELRTTAAPSPSSSNAYEWRYEKRLEFKPSLDLRGKRADEAMAIVQSYIDECIVAEARQVKILHGTGTGVLRQLIRQYLRTIPLVARAYDERVEMGGAGITIVEFEY